MGDERFYVLHANERLVGSREALTKIAGAPRGPLFRSAPSSHAVCSLVSHGGRGSPGRSLFSCRYCYRLLKDNRPLPTHRPPEWACDRLHPRGIYSAVPNCDGIPRQLGEYLANRRHLAACTRSADESLTLGNGGRSPVSILSRSF